MSNPQPQPQPRSVTLSVPEWLKLQTPRQWWLTRKERRSTTNWRAIIAAIVLAALWVVVTYLATYWGLPIFPPLDSLPAWGLILALLALAVVPFVLVTKTNKWIAVLGLLLGVVASWIIATQWVAVINYVTVISPWSVVGFIAVLIASFFLLRVVGMPRRVKVAAPAPAAPATPAVPATTTTTTTT